MTSKFKSIQALQMISGKLASKSLPDYNQMLSWEFFA